jgi:hypothetical protein
MAGQKVPTGPHEARPDERLRAVFAPDDPAIHDFRRVGSIRRLQCEAAEGLISANHNVPIAGDRDNKRTIFIIVACGWEETIVFEQRWPLPTPHIKIRIPAAAGYSYLQTRSAGRNTNLEMPLAVFRPGQIVDRYIVAQLVTQFIPDDREDFFDWRIKDHLRVRYLTEWFVNPLMLNQRIRSAEVPKYFLGGTKSMSSGLAPATSALLGGTTSSFPSR